MSSATPVRALTERAAHVPSLPVSSLDHAAISDRLINDPIRIEGRMPWSSNATFLVTLAGQGFEAAPTESSPEPVDQPDDYGPDDDSDEDDSDDDGEGGLPPVPEGAIRGIYKPGRGERPLWDFPRGLYRREIAAYELSRLLGWDVVPPTVMRDGDYGPGSLQFFIDADFATHYFGFLEDETLHPQLRRMAVFDIIANNTDRKGGHVLADANRHLWGIDNGLCFNEDPKLRTVIWDFAGESVPADLIDDIVRFIEADVDALGPLCSLLSPDEISAARRRAATLLDRGELPAPRSDHAYPWPLV
jgi:uncharacterized repeat protein (TIGR03843 family)